MTTQHHCDDHVLLPDVDAGRPNDHLRQSLVARLMMTLVRGYQLYISPAFPQSCRYFPSCSAYGLEALRVHGAVKGTILTIWRLLRCNPLSGGGVDHVPDPGQWRYPYPHDVPRFMIDETQGSTDR